MSVSCKMRSGAQIGVGLLPGRKRIALYTVRGCHLVVLAWFCSETDAADFCRIMWNVTYPDAEPYSEPVSAALAAPGKGK